MIHATKRAIERLRWPVGTVGIKYLADIGEIACGAKFRNAKELFRAEDARALQAGRRTSKIEGDEQRHYRLPTCEACAVAVDHALENPFVIHASAYYSVDFDGSNDKTACGERIDPSSPLLFDQAEFDHNYGYNNEWPLWLPTCATCRATVETALHGDFAKAFK